MTVEHDVAVAEAAVRALVDELAAGRISATDAATIATALARVLPASPPAWLTIAEASRRLGVAPEALRARANRSAATIVSKWIGKRRVVSWPSVVAELRQQPLRPRITRKQHASAAVAGQGGDESVDGDA